MRTEKLYLEAEDGFQVFSLLNSPARKTDALIIDYLKMVVHQQHTRELVELLNKKYQSKINPSV